MDLLEAAEDYELALSRLAWARDCSCDLRGQQLEALEWLCQDCDKSRTVMEALRAS